MSLIKAIRAALKAFRHEWDRQQRINSVKRADPFN